MRIHRPRGRQASNNSSHKRSHRPPTSPPQSMWLRWLMTMWPFMVGPTKRCWAMAAWIQFWSVTMGQRGKVTSAFWSGPLRRRPKEQIWNVSTGSLQVLRENVGEFIITVLAFCKSVVHHFQRSCGGWETSLFPKWRCHCWLGRW